AEREGQPSIAQARQGDHANGPGTAQGGLRRMGARPSDMATTLRLHFE
ncbi:MAG TPA: transposase, partial [Ktedonobacteraceae bacterium]|nr:transposase [Ktedonobacteraceae bacterium]